VSEPDADLYPPGTRVGKMELLVPLLVAMTVTFIVAMASLALLFAMVKRIRIDVFGYYTIALGLAGILIITL